MARTSSTKSKRDQSNSSDDGQDDLARLLRIQQQAIRRGARWWIEASRRFQRGDLSPESWLEAQADYLRKCLEDVKDASELMPLRARDSKDDGGKDR